MAQEKFIVGKHDQGHHDGLYANKKREIESTILWCELWPELVEAVESGTLESEEEFLPVTGGVEKKGKYVRD